MTKNDMFVYMINYDTGSKILINRERIIKVEQGYAFVRLFYNEDEYIKVKYTLHEAERILNGK